MNKILEWRRRLELSRNCLGDRGVRVITSSCVLAAAWNLEVGFGGRVQLRPFAKDEHRLRQSRSRYF